MRHLLSVSLLAASVLIVTVGTSCTVGAGPEIPDLDRRAAALNKTIMCPVCPGESIDQSQNPLALQMRAVVGEKLSDGWSERQIKDFLVERYGPSVLLEPPTAGFSLAAWIVPPLAFALAIAALLLTLKWMRMSADNVAETSGTGEDSPESYLSKINDALGPATPSEDILDDLPDSTRRPPGTQET